MMKKSLFGLAAAAVLSFLLPNAVDAQQLIVNGSGQLTGANGVNINGALYDVTFSTGSCNDAYNGCNPSDFTFSNAVDAQAAAQALLDQVFIDGSSGQFDSVATLTAGCTYAEQCRAAVPYSTSSNSFGPYVSSYIADNYSEPSGGPIDSVWQLNDGVAYDASTGDAQIWTHFTLEAGVPEPSTWALMLLGLGAVGAAMRRSRRTDRLPQRA